jgi:glycosyltransferase involved in cell wall biosynthesis
VDDGSTDSTKSVVKEIARKDRRVRPFSIKHSGKSSALNYGIRKAKFDIVAYIDADSGLGERGGGGLLRP